LIFNQDQDTHKKSAVAHVQAVGLEQNRFSKLAKDTAQENPPGIHYPRLILLRFIFNYLMHMLLINS